MRKMLGIAQGLLPPLALALVAAVAGLLYAAPAGAAVFATSDSLDQDQSATSTYQVFIGGGAVSELAQIATAGQWGFLDRISVYVDRVSGTQPVMVSIQTVSGGAPSGTIIGNGTIAASALPSNGNPEWVSANISGSMRLAMAPDTQFAIVLSTAAGDIIRLYASADVYPRGSMVAKYDTGWNGVPSADAMFQTYVILETPDQRQTEHSSVLWRSLSGPPAGQTFTAGAYGILDRVSAYLYSIGAWSAPIAASLRTVTSDGLPTATQVTGGTLPAGTFPVLASGWVTGNLSPVVVTPGTKYAVILTGPTAATWVYHPNVYGGGSMVVKNGTTWAETSPSYDFAFQMRVIPQILDQQQPVAELPGSICFQCQPSIARFIPTWSGMLHQVSLALSRSGLGLPPSYGTAVVSILDKSGVEIGRGTIPFAELDPSPKWVDVTVGIPEAVTSSVPVVAGTEYAIGVSVIDGQISWYQDSQDNKAYKTYILPLTGIASGPAPPPSSVITPCASSVCPEASGRLTPADLTDGVTTHFQFRERPNGTVQGILNFADPSPDGIKLQGCTTESAACKLTVTTFACTDEHAITIAGTYTSKGGTATDYLLDLSGVGDGVGNFTLNTGRGYSYTLTQDGIVAVICPPAEGVAAGHGGGRQK